MNSIKVNLFYNTLLSVSRVFFPLITAPYVTRVLSPDDLGLFNFGSSYAQYFAFFALLGIPFYGAREIAKVRDSSSETNKLFSELFSIAFYNTLFISIIYVLSIIYIDKFERNYLVFLIVGIGLYCSPLNIDWFYGGLENFKHITIRSLTIKVIGVILLFTCVRSSDDLLIYVAISVLSVILSDLWNFVVLYRLGYRVSLTLKGLNRHLKPLTLLFASTLAATIYTVLDTLMLGFIREYSQVAYYTYAMNISKTLLAAITSLSAVAVPRMSYYLENKQYDEINKLFNKSFSLVSFFAIPMVSGIILISPTFIPLFLGESFVGSVIPLQILSSLLIFIGLNNITAVQCLVGLGYDKLFLYSVLIGTFANFFLNLLLIPEYGAIGASVASMVAEFGVLVASMYFVVKFVRVRIISYRDTVCSILASCSFVLVFIILWHYLTGWLLFFSFILMSGLVYFSIQYIFKNQTLSLLAMTILNKIKK